MSKTAGRPDLVEARGSQFKTMFSYLVLVKVIHSLCDTITVIHPHYPGKPGDEAGITWRWVDGRVRASSTLIPGVSNAEPLYP